MTQAILEAIDAFMDAESPEAVPENMGIRKGLYEAMVEKVTNDWGVHSRFYQRVFEHLKTDYDRGSLNAKASILQEVCARVVDELDEVKRNEYTRERMYRVKELIIAFRSAMEEFQVMAMKEFDIKYE